MTELKSPLFSWLRRHWYLVAFILIVGLAIFYRFYQLNHLPPGLHPDEASNGLDVFRILQKHDFRPLYNTNGPREALFFYLQAMSVAFFGNTILALRLVPAVIGSLAVIVTFLWLKKWFGSRVAFFGAFFMAVSPWAITFSRDGFRASMVPLFIPLVLWLYTIALERKKLFYYLLAGASLGAGLYTYLSFRAFPVALGLAVILGLAFHVKGLKAALPKLLLSLVATAIVLLPMGIFALHDSADVIGARSSVGFTNQSLNHGQPVKTLLNTVYKTAIMFNFHGDDNYRHNLGGQPELNFFVGIMFILGILLCFIKLKKPKYALLIIIFGCMLVPEMVTAEGIPHSLRAIGALPLAFAFAALGVNYLLESWYKVFPTNSAARSVGVGALTVLFVLTAYQGYRQYFVAWANSPQTYEAFSEDVVAMANYMIKQPAGIHQYVAVGDYSNKTIQYLTDKKAAYTRLDTPDLAKFQPQTPFLLILPESSHSQLVKMKQRFPKSQITAYYSSFNDAELFDIVTVK